MAVITVTQTSTTPSVVACNCSPWWRGAGLVIPSANCIIAYTPVGATSKNNSLINSANPGTNDAVEYGGTVDWASATGWTFPGLSSGLYCGTLTWEDASSSLFVRCTNPTASDTAIVAGYTTGTDSESWYIIPKNLGNKVAYNNYANTASDTLAEVIGFAGQSCYAGIELVATLGAQGTPHNSLLSIGYNRHGDDKFWAGNVLAVAMYDIALTHAQATALVIAMQALPNYADG